MIRTQIKLMFSKFDFYIALLICTVMSIIYFIKAPHTPAGMVSHEYLYWGNGYTSGFATFSTIYPFLIVIPFATSFIDDLSRKTYLPMTLRGDKQKYILGKYIAVFIGNFLMIFVPFLLNLILCFALYDKNSVTPFGDRWLGNLDGVLYGTNIVYDTPCKKTLFADVFFDNPFFYHILYLLLFAFITGMLGVFVMAISMWMKKFKILLFVPVYVLMSIAGTYTSISLNKAISNPNRTFINFNILDYVSPFNTIGGCYYPVLIGVMIVITLFAAISGIHVVKKDVI